MVEGEFAAIAERTLDATLVPAAFTAYTMKL